MQRLNNVSQSHLEPQRNLNLAYLEHSMKLV
jgi:hypothetical protein